MKEHDNIAVAGLTDRLGRFAENHPRLLIKLGNLESAAYGDKIRRIPIDRPIYVCGLARAGSTILLEMLASHPDAATHRYKDFPFVHIPVWWNWFLARASRESADPVERFHKDRILVTQESPEAMEEIVWMAFFRDCHDPGISDVLGAETGNGRFEDFYRDHIRKVLYLRNGTRYIAKGNYNVTRIPYLRKLFSQARFVIPVRDPVHHVASLMKQHRLFCDEERRDPRILDYMRRVGHFEFGLNRTPINTGDRARVERIEELWRRGDEARGWACLWASVYAFAADMLEGNRELADSTLLVCYEDLCGSPQEMLEALYSHCALSVDRETLIRQAGQLSAPSYYSVSFSREETEAIREETQAVHERILRLSQVPPSQS
ncbi:MAG: sulfotransferase [Deltaproteobacteria bacterium]